MTRFGSWSTLLAVLAVELLAFAALLLWSRTNRRTNGYMAAVIVVIAGMLTPYVLGYAGYYDAYPWLSYAPFAVPLAVGPLLYAHVLFLTERHRLPARHFAAPAFQFLYQAIIFPLPVAMKARWDDVADRPWIDPLLSAAVLISMTYYAIACWRSLRRYEAWLADRRRDPRPARRIRLATSLLGALLAMRALYDLFDALVRPTTYFDMFAFYILLGLTGLVLGADSWRNAPSGVPPITPATERDWGEQGEIWIARLREAQWWRDSSLDLRGLARLLGTNTAQLSRALNDRHGGFSRVLARIRAEAVAEALKNGSVEDDLLGVGLAAGFGSKASFNRAFRAHYGVSPTDYRAARARLSS